MLEPVYKTKFKKDLKLVTKRGKSIEKLKTVIRQLIEEKPLETKYNDHSFYCRYYLLCQVKATGLLRLRLAMTVILTSTVCAAIAIAPDAPK